MAFPFRDAILAKAAAFLKRLDEQDDVSVGTTPRQSSESELLPVCCRKGAGKEQKNRERAADKVDARSQ
jgi:hypothetical protein